MKLKLLIQAALLYAVAAYSSMAWAQITLSDGGVADGMLTVNVELVSNNASSLDFHININNDELTLLNDSCTSTASATLSEVGFNFECFVVTDARIGSLIRTILVGNSLGIIPTGTIAMLAFNCVGTGDVTLTTDRVNIEFGGFPSPNEFPGDSFTASCTTTGNLPIAIPTLSEWTMLITILVLVLGTFIVTRYKS